MKLSQNTPTASLFTNKESGVQGRSLGNNALHLNKPDPQCHKVCGPTFPVAATEGAGIISPPRRASFVLQHCVWDRSPCYLLT